MKTKMLLLLCSAAISVRAQFRFNDLDAGKPKNVEIKIDLKNPDAGKMKVIVETTPSGRKDEITLHNAANSAQTVTPAYDPEKENLVFELSGEIKKGIYIFELKQQGKTVGKITYKNTPAASGKEENTREDDDDDSDGSGDFKTYMAAMASANLVGNNKFLSNLTPVVNLGGISKVMDNKVFNWDIEINPYIGAEIDTKDSVSFMPAMMLYGRAGLTVNNFFNFKIGKNVTLNFMPIGLGMKFIPNLKDSSNNIIQHNIRTSLSFSFDKRIMISAQYTHGWHNITSESEANFKKIFGNMATDIRYLTITGHFGIAGKNSEITNYLFMEWRGLLGKDRFAAFTNNRILTIGIRKSLELRSNGISGAATGVGRSSSERPKQLHHGL